MFPIVKKLLGKLYCLIVFAFCSISVWAQKEIRKFPGRETRIMSGSAEKCFHHPAQSVLNKKSVDGGVGKYRTN